MWFRSLKQVRRIAVRKVLRAKSAVRVLDTTSLASAVMAAIGILLYIMVFESNIILTEAFVWFIEALSFLGLMVAFHVAASRATAYRARYEFLRLEALAALALSVIGVLLTGYIVAKSILGGKSSPTPLPLSLYPLTSALLSFLLERRLHKVFHRLEARLVVIKTVARKLALDVVLEVSGGLAIIASNTLHNPLVETMVVFATAVYVLHGLGSIALESTLYLIGVGPHHVIERTRRSVERIIWSRTGRRPARLRVETFGTFSEVEVWVEAPPYMSLETAYKYSMNLAKEVVKKVPEVVRAIVILVPWSRSPRPRRRPRTVKPGIEGYVGIKHRRRAERGERSTMEERGGGRGEEASG